MTMITTMITAFGFDEEALTFQRNGYKQFFREVSNPNLWEDMVGPVTFCGTLVKHLDSKIIDSKIPQICKYAIFNGPYNNGTLVKGIWS